MNEGVAGMGEWLWMEGGVAGMGVWLGMGRNLAWDGGYVDILPLP